MVIITMEPPYDDIDPGMRDLIRTLFESGFYTHESCQGGPGHARPLPTVLINRQHDLKSDIKPFLKKHGYRIFCVSKGQYDRINPFWRISLEPWPGLSYSPPTGFRRLFLKISG